MSAPKFITPLKQTPQTSQRVLAALLLVAFVSILQHGRQMLLGEPTGGHTDRRTPAIALTTLAIALGASAVLGVTLGPLDRLLTAASRVVAP